MEKEWGAMADRKTAEDLGYKYCHDKNGLIITRPESDGTTSTLMAFIRPTISVASPDCCDGGPQWGHSYGCKNTI